MAYNGNVKLPKGHRDEWKWYQRTQGPGPFCAFHSFSGICGRPCPSTDALKTHIETDHFRKCPHRCMLCQWGFERQDLLNGHLENHARQLGQCAHCGTKFTDTPNYLQHLIQTHGSPTNG
ncbi:hypothetical protein DAEQUDRAFT_720425 [Daedalea quercina L-15889]|uniref:C2H2-type domain-containing protein n=1 Tax=Daedalea quercina L-15889 TaxID=1314783 RepID=A0A165U1N6_9APHY|nr:hypothetical protein DAEQUDRAFT_720425 [Daedalea quercina L-15889]